MFLDDWLVVLDRFRAETGLIAEHVFGAREAQAEANAFTANFHDAALLFSLVNPTAGVTFTLRRKYLSREKLQASCFLLTV